MASTLSALLHPPLTRWRIAAAFAAAIIADAVQLFAGPFGWPFIDDGVDVIAMVVTTLAIGFHPLLLPTMAVELLPVVDLAPTWTAAVSAVVLFRRRHQPAQATALPPVRHG